MHKRGAAQWREEATKVQGGSGGQRSQKQNRVNRTKKKGGWTEVANSIAIYAQFEFLAVFLPETKQRTDFEGAKKQHHQRNPELDSPPGRETKMKRRPNTWRRDLEAQVGQLCGGTHLCDGQDVGGGTTVLDG